MCPQGPPARPTAGLLTSRVTRSCLTLSDPMDCSPPGSSIHGIFQARVLEWGAIAFSPMDYTVHGVTESDMTE